MEDVPFVTAVMVNDQAWERITDQQADVLLQARDIQHGAATGWQTVHGRNPGETARGYLFRAFSSYLTDEPDLSDNYGLPANYGPQPREVRYCRACAAYAPAQNQAWMLGRRSNHVASALHRAAVEEQLVQRGRLEERERVRQMLVGMPQDQIGGAAGMRLLLASLTSVFVVTDVATGGRGLRRLMAVFLRPEMIAWWDQHHLILAWVAILAFMVLLVGVFVSVVGFDRDAAHGRERQRRCQRWCRPLLVGIIVGSPVVMTFGFGYDLKLVLLLYLGCLLALVFIGGCTRLLGLH